MALHGSEAGLVDALSMYGPAPGSKELLERERAAAEHTLRLTRVYVTWRGKDGSECTRIGPTSLCFCGHNYDGHEVNLKKNVFPCRQSGCCCRRFEYMPSRPEECGEWWLPRRRDFDVRSYEAKCKCSHGHLSHDPGSSRRCSVCRCPSFTSAFLCVVCDEHSERHETIWETEAERKAANRSVGSAYLPLAATPELSAVVFNDPTPGSAAFACPINPNTTNVSRSSQRLALPTYGSSIHAEVKFGTSRAADATSDSRVSLRPRDAPGNEVVFSPSPGPRNGPRSFSFNRNRESSALAYRPPGQAAGTEMVSAVARGKSRREKPKAKITVSVASQSASAMQ
jgi:hypothetical protein